MIIETDHLMIRPLSLRDLEDVQVAKEESWHDLQMWMSWAHDHMLPRAQLADFIASRPPQHPWDAAIAREKRTGRFAVMSGVSPASSAVAGDCSTGYWAARAMRGRGYATEATNALIRHAFASMGAKRVLIEYYQDNEPSRRVIEKLGFTFVRTKPAGHARCLDGTLLDVHTFEMTDPAVLPPLAWRLIRADDQS